MSRQELADAVNAYLWKTYQQRENLDENDIGKLERGDHRWPGGRRREAFRAVLEATTDAELGLYIRRRPSRADTVDPALDPGGDPFCGDDNRDLQAVRSRIARVGPSPVG